jgi:hypothetical protein
MSTLAEFFLYLREEIFRYDAFSRYVQLKLIVMLYVKFFGPAVPLLYSSVGIGPSNRLSFGPAVPLVYLRMGFDPSNRFSFGPAVPLFILNTNIVFSNHFLSGLQCPRFI